MCSTGEVSMPKQMGLKEGEKGWDELDGVGSDGRREGGR
jgi:hypothetical protein